MDAKDAAEATTAILFDGALMLGAAVLTVERVRRLQRRRQPQDLGRVERGVHSSSGTTLVSDAKS